MAVRKRQSLAWRLIVDDKFNSQIGGRGRRATIVAYAILVCIGTIILSCSEHATGPSAAKEIILLENAAFPNWSLDGSAIICDRIDSNRVSHIEIVELKTRIHNTLVTAANCEYGPLFPRYMPQGEAIIFYCMDSVLSERFFEIWPLASGPTKVVRMIPVPRGMWDDAAFTLSPDGSKIYYTSWEPDSGNVVMALSIEDNTVDYICRGDQACISPDGEWMAIGSEDSIVIASINGSERRSLEPGWWISWTPDSKYIVFSGLSSDSGFVDLIIRSIDGSYRRELTHDREYDLHCAVSPQGGIVAYTKAASADEGPFDVRLLRIKDPRR